MSAASAWVGLRRRAGLRVLRICLSDAATGLARGYAGSRLGLAHGVKVRGARNGERIGGLVKRFATESKSISGAGSAAQVAAVGGPGPRPLPLPPRRDPVLRPLAAVLVVTTAIGGGFVWWTWEDGGREAVAKVLDPAVNFLGVKGFKIGEAKPKTQRLLGVHQKQGVEEPGDKATSGKENDEGELLQEGGEGEGREQSVPPPPEEEEGARVPAHREEEDLVQVAEEEEEETGAEMVIVEDVEDEGDGREMEGREQPVRRRKDRADPVSQVEEVDQKEEGEYTPTTEEEERSIEQEEEVSAKVEAAFEEEEEAEERMDDKVVRGVDPQADVTMSEMAADLGARLFKVTEREEEERESQPVERVEAGEDGAKTTECGTVEGVVMKVERVEDMGDEKTEEGDERASADDDKEKKAGKPDEEELRELGSLIYGMLLKQEENIRLIFESKIQRIEEDHRQELNNERANVVRHAQKASALEKEITKQSALHLQELKEQQRIDEEKRKKTLHQVLEEEKRKLAEMKAALEAKSAAMVASERAARIEVIDKLRVKVNALQLAFNGHAEESRRSTDAHKIAMAVFILEDALMEGVPLAKLAKALEALIAAEDPLVHVAVASLSSPEISSMGAPTRVQLWNKFKASKKTMKELALVPRGGGGVLAHATAKLAATLKMREQDSDLDGGGSDAVLARAEALLVEGRLLEAASTVQEGLAGTSAQDVANHWVQLVRNRIVAEQAVSMMQATATVMAIAST